MFVVVVVIIHNFRFEVVAAFSNHFIMNFL